MTDGFEITSQNASALFTLKLHRGDGMVLIGMNWKEDKPPLDFVGFAIEFKEPNGDKFFFLSNREGEEWRVNDSPFLSPLSTLHRDTRGAR